MAIFKFKLVEELTPPPIISNNNTINEAKKKRQKLKLNIEAGVPIFKSTDDIKKWVKKRQKGMGSFVTYDCGNMEYNNHMFNKMHGDTSNSVDNVTPSIGDTSIAQSDVVSSASGMGESLNLDSYPNSNNKISPEVKNFIQSEKDTIQNNQWEQLSDKFIKYNFCNEHIAEFYNVMESSNINIPQDVKEIILINRLNKAIAKLKGTPDRYKIFLNWVENYGIYSTLETLWEHTYNFDEQSVINILKKYKDKLIISLEELKL